MPGRSRRSVEDCRYPAVSGFSRTVAPSCSGPTVGVSSLEMSRKGGIGPWRSLATLGVLIYTVFLVTAPFEHHDLLCHLKNPRHCTSCTASQLGSDPQALIMPSQARLADAGRATTLHLTAAGALLPVRSTGRSPPTHA
jgi:hypothetical protein